MFGNNNNKIIYTICTEHKKDKESRYLYIESPAIQCVHFKRSRLNKSKTIIYCKILWLFMGLKDLENLFIKDSFCLCLRIFTLFKAEFGKH